MRARCIAFLFVALLTGSLLSNVAPAQSQSSNAAISDSDKEAVRKSLEAYHRGDYATALRWLRVPADEGFPPAELMMGVIYFRGKGGVERDVAESIQWLRKAAEHGSVEAQDLLGSLYWEGKDIPRDYAEAFHWYQMAAEQNNAEAQYWLGTMYKRGLGTSLDHAQGLIWLHKSAEQNYAMAQTQVGSEYYSEHDYTHALIWLRKAADQNEAYAQAFLGSMYATGEEGVAQDPDQALALCSKSAEQGNSEGQMCMGTLYRGGVGVPKDLAKARAWYAKAIAQGNDTAKEYLRHLEAESAAASSKTARNNGAGREIDMDAIPPSLRFRCALESSGPAMQAVDAKRFGTGTGERQAKEFERQTVDCIRTNWKRLFGSRPLPTR